ncbi:MAG TPA: outer membrane protein assembly factor BamE, partial [Gallionella sp.]|nr:outer membrane protein assembly factor BamE [Gallionella sp.]
MMRTKLIFLSVLLASCGSGSPSVPLLTPYKMDIRQGNYITPEMREKLRFGMTKQQVRFVLGTPMVSDAFHGNRWDYVYSLEREGKIVEKQRMTLLFDGDNLVSIDDGKSVQTAPPVVAEAVAPESVKAAPVADRAADVLKSVQGWAAAWSAKNTS